MYNTVIDVEREQIEKEKSQQMLEEVAQKIFVNPVVKALNSQLEENKQDIDAEFDELKTSLKRQNKNLGDMKKCLDDFIVTKFDDFVTNNEDALLNASHNIVDLANKGFLGVAEKFAEQQAAFSQMDRVIDCFVQEHKQDVGRIESRLNDFVAEKKAYLEKSESVLEAFLTRQQNAINQGCDRVSQALITHQQQLQEINMSCISHAKSQRQMLWLLSGLTLVACSSTAVLAYMLMAA